MFHVSNALLFESYTFLIFFACKLVHFDDVIQPIRPGAQSLIIGIHAMIVRGPPGDAAIFDIGDLWSSNGHYRHQLSHLCNVRPHMGPEICQHKMKRYRVVIIFHRLGHNL